MKTDLGALFGSIDIYLFDQLLRGRIVPGMRVFDAGCGRGRNLVFFLREGYEVRALDPEPGAVEEARDMPHPVVAVQGIGLGYNNYPHGVLFKDGGRINPYLFTNGRCQRDCTASDRAARRVK